MYNIGIIVCLLIVSILWGLTNPLMKSASVGIEHIKHANLIRQTYEELKFLVFNWKYVSAFLINQSGSILYYIILGMADISIVVPVTNSLTFIVTVIAGHFLGEKVNNKLTYAGIALVMAGVTLCLLSANKMPAPTEFF